MALSQTTVLRLYNTVMEDVIAGVRETFLDDGVDETVLQELRVLWENKLLASKAVEQNPDPPEHQPPPIVSNLKANGNKAGTAKKGPIHTSEQLSTGPNQMSHATNNSISNSGPQQSASNTTTAPNLVSLDPNNKVPVQLTLPAQAGVPGSQPRVFTLQIPTSALQNNQLHHVLTGPVITATMNLPQSLAATLLQQHINAAFSGQQSNFNTTTTTTINRSQVDGACDSSDDEISDGAASDEDAEAEAEGEEAGSGAASEGAEGEGEEEGEGDGGPEEEPLNSEDDVSEEDPSDMFDTENVVVCQYDKITRSRNKWKFYLKDGIMNLSGRDFVFQKANGDAEW